MTPDVCCTNRSLHLDDSYKEKMLLCKNFKSLLGFEAQPVIKNIYCEQCPCPRNLDKSVVSGRGGIVCDCSLVMLLFTPLNFCVNIDVLNKYVFLLEIKAQLIPTLISFYFQDDDSSQD